MHSDDSPAPARSARARARDQITAEILAAARIRLAAEGPAGLSLRAVARDVGMVSSAVYRYFASRDELLTALLVLAYDDLGLAAERADATVADRSDLGARWLVSLRAVRRWALANPGDYALLYGSPVPGYAAPQTTVEPAARVILVILGIVLDGAAAGAEPSPPPPSADLRRDEAAVADAIGWVRMRDLVAPEVAVPAELVIRTLLAWTTVFGTISFELFGHLVGSVSDRDDYFDAVLLRLAADLGLPTDFESATTAQA
ncbi:TetR/AcrR family transcriptional regulator [Herbiconiux moechotypicola]|uniref:TetR/AcrR family transcriptional regulator n=1 Tax=Herbiconiux moechotypicola TaxID=637393 RepID=A0ABN3E4N3_9MICO|nr:TetR/AcrR family transcriptional regulator [Herbiconiux moechotypicola]MCS5731804.1 TetR/AcrR family transcriptional regulator [Herbiconiux moechotypicola]